MSASSLAMSSPASPHAISTCTERRLPLVKSYVVMIEIILVLACAYFSTSVIQKWSPQTRLRGQEFSYLINSGTIANRFFKLSGSIPLWNPLIGQGEPLIESPFSFVLNPLMTWPTLLTGEIQGTKTSAIIHTLLMGLGAWLLARVLRLKLPIRLFLAALLIGSGSYVASLGTGFYQMSLSQTYVPWILAGLLGTLTLDKRWPVAILVVATTLMIFAGTFWYVLPAAIACDLLVIANGWPSRKQLRRLAIAGFLILGLSAIRLIPQFINRDLMYHPGEHLGQTRQFWDVFQWYFNTELPPNSRFLEHLLYHYIMPRVGAAALLVGGLGVGAYWLWRRRQKKAGRGNLAAEFPDAKLKLGVFIVGLILIFIFMVWTQENVPVVKWFYEHIRLLDEWRFVTRVGAAASLWIAIVAALLFDSILLTLWHILRSTDANATRRFWFIARRNIPVELLLIIYLVVGAFSAASVLQNWQNWAGTQQLGDNDPLLVYLHNQYPYRFLSVLSDGFYDYYSYYNTLTRAALGNPDYHPVGLDPTIGQDKQAWMPEFAIVEEPIEQSLRDKGYVAVDDPIPLPDNSYYTLHLYQKSIAPYYAFWGTIDTIKQAGDLYLSNYKLTPVTYYHHINSVSLEIGDHDPDAVAVVTETAYPGWEVTVNGQPTKLESVNRVLAVRLPDGPSVIEFTYRPRLLYISAGISALGMLAFVFYTLALDRLFKRRSTNNISN